MNINSMYTNVTNYASDDTLEARTEIVVSRSGRDTRTIYVPKGTPEAVAIPALKLDMSKVAEAQAWSANMFEDLSK